MQIAYKSDYDYKRPMPNYGKNKTLPLNCWVRLCSFPHCMNADVLYFEPILDSAYYLPKICLLLIKYSLSENSTASHELYEG